MSSVLFVGKHVWHDAGRPAQRDFATAGRGGHLRSHERAWGPSGTGRLAGDLHANPGRVAVAGQVAVDAGDGAPRLHVRTLCERDAKAYYELMTTVADSGELPAEARFCRGLAGGVEKAASMLVAYRAGGSSIMGVFDGSRMVGAAGLSMTFDACRGNAGRIWGIAVAPMYTGTPVSRMLIDAVVGLCLATDGISVIFGVCAASNSGVRHLFVRSGFARMGRDQDKVYGAMCGDGFVVYFAEL